MLTLSLEFCAAEVHLIRKDISFIQMKFVYRVQLGRPAVKVEKYKSALTYIMFHGEMKCNFGNRFDIWDFPVLERQNLLQTWKCSVCASGGSCAQFSKAPLAADNGELLAVFREADAYLCSYSVQSWLDDKVRRRTSHHRVGAIGSWYPAGEG